MWHLAPTSRRSAIALGTSAKVDDSTTPSGIALEAA